MPFPRLSLLIQGGEGALIVPPSTLQTLRSPSPVRGLTDESSGGQSTHLGRTLGAAGRRNRRKPQPQAAPGQFPLFRDLLRSPEPTYSSPPSSLLQDSVKSPTKAGFARLGPSPFCPLSGAQPQAPSPNYYIWISQAIFHWQRAPNMVQKSKSAALWQCGKADDPQSPP